METEKGIKEKKIWKRARAMTACIVMCLFAILATFASAGTTSESYQGIIRFHVIANSDSEEDQALKLKVRDRVLEYVNKELEAETMKKEMVGSLHTVMLTEKAVEIQDSIWQWERELEITEDEAKSKLKKGAIGKNNNPTVTMSIEEAREYIQANIEAIEEVALQEIREQGYEYGVKAELGNCFIPRKTYGEIAFPAGNYEALNLIIGSGEGQNWWCVLFPPLCIIDPEGESLEEATVGESTTAPAIQLKFKLAEMLE